MTSILDACLARQFHTPATPQEYLALQIARKLGDLEHVREYIILLETFSEEIIVDAFRRARSTKRLHREGFREAFKEVIHINHDQYEQHFSD